MADIDDSLRSLIARGFQFLHPRDVNGRVVVIVGIRPHHDVIDVVQLYGERDADAVRMPANEPNIFFPHTVLWRASGPSGEVIEKLLALRDPETTCLPDRPGSTSNGCWVPTQPGRSKWLAASE